MASHSEFAVHGDMAAAGLGDVFDDGKTQACAAKVILVWFMELDAYQLADG